MIKKALKSKFLAFYLILSFLLLITTEVAPNTPDLDTNKEFTPVVRVKESEEEIPAAQKNRFERLIEEGKKLFQEEMDYEAAEGKFKEAQTLAITRAQKADVLFYLSLVYYATAQQKGTEEFDETIRKLIEIDYYREPDLLLCPPRYMVLFQGIKKEYGVIKIQSKPAGADVYLGESRVSAGKTPLTIGAKAGSVKIRVKKGNKEKKETLRVVAGKETASSILALKGGSSLLLIIGGLALAGGGAAAFLGGGGNGGGNGGAPTPTTGSIQINSTPTGAQVYIDGNNTGQTTNCTLTNISPGNHTVKLVKEGYEDCQESASVTAGQTTTLSINLTRHTLTISNPISSTIWTTGQNAEIAWETSASTSSPGNVGSGAGLNSALHPRRNLLSSIRRRAIRYRQSSRKFMKRRGEQESAGLTGAGRMISNRSSSNLDVSNKYSSSSKGVKNFPRGTKNIGADKKSISAGSINFPMVSGISPQIFNSLEDTKALELTNVKIDLYKGTSPVQIIAASTENDGSYMWTVPSALAEGTDYRIRISCVSDSSVYNESDEFQITSISICEAVDKCDLTWTTGGNADWFGQADTSYYDSDAVQSGAISDDQLTYVQTTVTGEGTLKFYWKVSSESDFDNLIFYVDGVPVPGYQISGEVSWEQKTYSIGAGSHSIKWEYKKDSSLSAGSDCGWLDKVEFITSAITITNPTSSTIWTKGNSADITWTSEGTITNVKIDLYKGTAFNQTIVSSTANDGSHTWPAVDPSLADGSDYKIRISDAANSSLYDESESFQITSSTICEAVDNCDLTWTTGGNADWFGQADTSYYDGDAVQSGAISDSQLTYVQTTVTGEGTLKFYWKVSSEEDFDYLTFYVDGVPVPGYQISGEVSWEQKTYSIGAGSHSIKWEYKKDFVFSEGTDCGWLDKVEFVTSPITVTNPTSSTIWIKGDSANITWTSEGAISNVKIDLYKGTTFNQTIVSSTANDGSYTWPAVDPSLADASDYKIRISDATNSSVYDESEAFQIAASGHYEFLVKWGSSGSGDSQFDWPSGVEVDNLGYVYVVDMHNDRVQKFTSSGSFVTKWGSYGTGDSQFDYPARVAVDSSGDVYVSDQDNHRIQKFTSDGTYITQWGSLGSGNGQFNEPWGIAIDSSDYIYVVDQSNHRIQKFTSDGTYVTQWGSLGTGDGYFDQPIGIAIDSSGYVYVADEWNDRIQKFTSSGSFVTKWGTFGTGDGQFNLPFGIAIDSSGYVYVADSQNDRIQKFTSDGDFVTKWGSSGTGDGQFDIPHGITVDSSGYVYVCDAGNDRIQKFQYVASTLEATKKSFKNIDNNFIKNNNSIQKSHNMKFPVQNRLKNKKNETNRDTGKNKKQQNSKSRKNGKR